uniref:Uncharacterized protein n=1 Tax=Trichogramma kaykai TaxID=54128 RepID=A0ABD2WW01_9HYME
MSCSQARVPRSIYIYIFYFSRGEFNLIPQASSWSFYCTPNPGLSLYVYGGAAEGERGRVDYIRCTRKVKGEQVWRASTKGKIKHGFQLSDKAANGLDAQCGGPYDSFYAEDNSFR